MFCPSCGAENSNQAKFCRACGHAFQKRPATAQPSQPEARVETPVTKQPARHIPPATAETAVKPKVRRVFLWWAMSVLLLGTAAGGGYYGYTWYDERQQQAQREKEALLAEVNRKQKELEALRAQQAAQQRELQKQQTELEQRDQRFKQMEGPAKTIVAGVAKVDASRPDVKVGDRWKFDSLDYQTGAVANTVVHEVTEVTPPVPE